MKTIIRDKIREWLSLVLLVAAGLFVCYHTFPPPVLHKLGLKSSDAIVELSGFGAFLTYATLGLVLLRICTSYMYPGWDMKSFRDTSAWPEAGPRVWSSIILAIALIIASSIAKAEPAAPLHIQIALKYEGVKEKPAGSNSGREINMFLRSVGLSPGYSWCAAYVSYCLSEAGAKQPTVRSAMARAFITQKSIKSSEVLRGMLRVPDGSIVIWKRGTGPFGHVGFVVRQLSSREVSTIEGNTSASAKGSQSDGGGVYRRRRSISLTDHFRITHFTLVSYTANQA